MMAATHLNKNGGNSFVIPRHEIWPNAIRTAREIYTNKKQFSLLTVTGALKLKG